MNVTQEDRNLAETVPLTKQAFERIFTLVRPTDDTMELVALPEDDVDTIGLFAHGFAYMREQDWLSAFIAAIVREGLLTQAFAEAAETAGESFGQTFLQSIQNMRRGFQDVGDFGVAYGRVVRQVCRIDIDNIAKGTGFLLQPDLVLTNYHVIQELLNQAGDPIDGADERLSAVFDVYTRKVNGRNVVSQGRVVNAAQGGEWLFSKSPNHDSETLGTLPDDVQSLLDHYDYALIRLEGAAGIGLSGFAIEQTRSMQVDDEIFVFQHPQGRPQQFDIAKVTGLVGQGFRFEHSVNTESGSSGSPCLNRKLRVVGYHHAGGKNGPGVANGAASPNRGIPIANLIDIINALPEPETNLFPLAQLSDDSGHPVFGRRQTQDWIWQSVGETDRPILVLKGDPGKGKSFSHEIAVSLLPTVDHTTVLLDAKDFAADTPLQFAKRVLRAFSFPTDAIEDDPNTTTDDAWISRVLMPNLRDALDDGRGERTLWITLDELKNSNIPEQGGLRDALNLLYKMAGEVTWLRLMLLGYEAIPPREVQRLMVTESIADIEPEDIVDFTRLKVGSFRGDDYFNGVRDMVTTLIGITMDIADPEHRLQFLADKIGKVYGNGAAP